MQWPPTLTALFAIGCVAIAQPTDPPSQPTIQLPPALARVLADYEKAWTAKDAHGLAQLFSEDGFVLPSGSPMVRGGANIAEYYKGHGGPLFLRAVAYATSGPAGYMIGAYSKQPGGPDDGKFTLTLRKAGRRWLIVSDMDNSNRRPGPN